MASSGPGECGESIPSAPRVRIRRALHLPIRWGEHEAVQARAFTFTGLSDGLEHIALGLGPWQKAIKRSASGGPAILVRPHSECLTGDLFGSERCDCGPQLREAMNWLALEGGLLLYLRQEGRGIGLYRKMDAYALQDQGLDTYEANIYLGRGADERNYLSAAQMLQALDVSRVRLLSNNPDKASQMALHGIEVIALVRTEVHATSANIAYLKAKRSTSGHILDLDAEPRIGAGSAHPFHLPR